MASPVADLPPLFPYEPRPGQRELVGTLRRALLEGGHVVVESGTGTGKTVSALVAALSVARERGLRVLYLTRTNSQARQVMVEYRGLAQRGVAVALQGRAHLCPLRRLDPEVGAADADELALMCKDRMRAAEDELAGRKPEHPACPFHARGLADGQAELLAWARREAPDAERLVDEVVSKGQCPHVLTRRLLPDAELVVAPYLYLFHPHLRGPFLRWLDATMADLLVVVDEAHNLPDHARELATPRLSRRTLELARSEARSFGDPTVLPSAPLSRFLQGLEAVFAELREMYLPEGADDALLPPEEFDVLLMSQFAVSTPAIDRGLTVMEEYAAAVRDSRRRAGKLPRSHVGTVAAFLRAFRGLDPDTHAPLVERDGDGIRLVAYALDPTLVTDVLHECAGSVHMSGTLHPLEEYRATVGLHPGRTRLARFPSPFPPENRLVLVDDEVTTRHEDVARGPDMWDAIGQRLRDVRAATDRNVAVFLPSYDVLQRLAPHVRGEGAFIEVRGGTQGELMAQVQRFKVTRGGTLVSVIGGRVSEGLDFPDEELEVVVVVGLPYAKPSARGEALVRFYDRRFGRGWEWAVKVPMLRKTLQAAGRLIRTPTDRGVVVLLDRRAALLRDALPGLLVTRDPAGEVARFFGARKAAARPRDS